MPDGKEPVMQVSEVMRAPAVRVGPQVPVRAAARILCEEGVGCLPVERGGELLGIVTDRDLVMRCLAAGRDPESAVADVMSTPVATVGAADDFTAACRAFRRAEVHRLPVLDGGRTVGVVSVDDLLLHVHRTLADLLEPAARCALLDALGDGACGR
jgi:signal-transduction protein with cAMP-binding, CBS, and nucleotidyltransferase domain